LNITAGSTFNTWAIEIELWYVEPALTSLDFRNCAPVPPKAPREFLLSQTCFAASA
jgi:hypothetical protein